MATTGARRRPRKYPDELRERAVRMVFEVRRETGESHGVITRVARDLGVGAESLRGWVSRAEIDSGNRPGTSTVDAQRISELEREVKELRRANDILKAASVFFATELDGRPRRTTYWSAKTRQPCARKIRDAELGPKIESIWEKNYSVYGRRKLAKAARKAGLDVGRDQVARLMHTQGIRGASRAKTRFTTHADPAATRAPDLVKRDFTASRPDELRVADFTCCSTWSGVVYVAFVVDVFSRRIVGWKAARTMHSSLVVDALNMAAWTRRGTDLAGLICHNDAGSQYTSIAHTDRLAELDARASIGTVGDSYDNAMAEAVNALYKTELHRNPAVLAANGGHWRGLDDLEIATCRWVSWFNEHRLHGELGDLTPAEVEAAYYRDLRQAEAA